MAPLLSVDVWNTSKKKIKAKNIRWAIARECNGGQHRGVVFRCQKSRSPTALFPFQFLNTSFPPFVHAFNVSRIAYRLPKLIYTFPFSCITSLSDFLSSDIFHHLLLLHLLRSCARSVLDMHRFVSGDFGFSLLKFSPPITMEASTITCPEENKIRCSHEFIVSYNEFVSETNTYASRSDALWNIWPMR